jgi:hypothetical protein
MCITVHFLVDFALPVRFGGANSYTLKSYLGLLFLGKQALRAIKIFAQSLCKPFIAQDNL